jgi:hypothetical protein
MNSQRFILAALAGTVVYFLLGYLVYGVILKDTMLESTNAIVMRADADMVWWALVLGNFAFASLLTYLVAKTNTLSATRGATLGFTIGLLMCASMDLIGYATTTMMSKPSFIIADVLAGAIMAAVVGAVIAWVYNYKKAVVVA